MIILILSIAIEYILIRRLEIKLLGRIAIATFGGFMIAIFIFFLINIIFMIFGYHDSPPQVQSHELVALKDNSNVYGSTFVGTGSFEGALYYFVMVDEEKGLRMKKFKAEDVILVEGTDRPRVEQESWPLELNWLYMRIDHIGDTYIHVPKNTVTKSFEIDLE